MKTNLARGWRMILVLAGLPLVAGSLRAQDTNTTTQPATTSPVAAQLADAPPADAPPSEVSLSQGAAEIVKLAQAGLGEDVMLAYIGNVASKFNLGSDQILYLNDLGVSGAVVKAMIDRDTALENASQAAAASLLTPPVPPASTNATDDTSVAPPPPDDSMAASPPPYPGDYTGSDDSDYFYNALAPYGAWIYVSGCGLCWQPTLCVGNHDWRPYGDRGRWLYTDCGWYWQSDYTWGWAAFHYGRWFNDPNRGWCWSLDRVWGPAWVSWRSSADYCGWAPLPPSARYVPSSGFVYAKHLVGPGFEFGLQPQNYTFIPLARMSDYAPARYSVPRWQADEVFGQTALINHFSVHDNRVVNFTIDPGEISALSRVEIRQAQIRDLPRDPNRQFPSDRLAKTSAGMVIYRPQLPVPSASRPARTTLVAPRPALPTSLSQSARPETYPPGSLVVLGAGNSSAAPSQPTAPLPNMNLSYLAGQNNTAYQSVPETPGYASPAAGFNFNYDSAGLNSSARSAAQFQPAQNQTPYVMPGRFTASGRLNANPAPNFAAPTQSQSPAVIPGRFSVNDRLAGNSQGGIAAPAPANPIAEHVRAAAASAESYRTSQETPATAPAPAHVESASVEHSAPAPSSSSSSSSASSSWSHK